MLRERMVNGILDLKRSLYGYSFRNKRVALEEKKQELAVIEKKFCDDLALYLDTPFSLVS